MKVNSPILPQPQGETLGGVFRQVSHRHAQHMALIFQGQSITYADLEALVQRCMAQLLAWGVRSGDRVVCLAQGHPLQIAAWLALSEIGAIWVPLNFRLALAEWQQILQDCSPRCLLVDDDGWPAGQSLTQHAPIALHRLTDLDADPPPSVLERPEPNPQAPVLLVYTSGTTGQPKGAVHTLANVWANAQAAIHAQRLGPDDRVLTMLPLFHVGGLCIQTLPALLSGATVVLHPRFEPQAVWRDLARYHITLTLMVPAVMKAVIEHPAFHATPLPDLKAIWAGSSVLPDELLLPWHQRNIPVCNVYGATETGPFSLALGPEHARTHLGSCGWPALGVQAKLIDTSADGVGQVCLRGDAVVQRYWPDRPALDEEGWFHTGDLAALQADQSWRIVGRAKDMIISGGENIYPAEIEHILLRHPAVLECAVVGLPDVRWGEQVVAVVVLKPGLEASEEELLADVRQSLARYKHPRQLVLSSELPKTALGKIKKDQLVQQLTGRAGTAASPSVNSLRFP